MTSKHFERECANLEPQDQDGRTALVLQRKCQHGARYAREMARRREDRHVENWVRLEDFEAEIAGQQTSK